MIRSAYFHTQKSLGSGDMMRPSLILHQNPFADGAKCVHGKLASPERLNKMEEMDMMAQIAAAPLSVGGM